MISKRLFSLFVEFQKIPKGVLIDDPDGLVPADFIENILFTRRTLKHFAEKGREGLRLLDLMPNIFEYPDLILQGKGNRIMLARSFTDVKNGEPHIVILEPYDGSILVITSFVTDEKYLKNFEILWRTGGSRQ